MILEDLVNKSRLAFEVEGSKDGHLCGWIFERAAPARRVQIEVEANDGIVAIHLADLYRADVHRADLGSDGYCGFAIPIHDWGHAKFRLRAAQPRCVFGQWSPIRRPRARAFSRLGDLLFQLDPRDRPISGWLSSTNQPHDRRSIRVEVDGRDAFLQRACLFRRDLAPQAIDGFHGFSVPLPPLVGEFRLMDAGSGQLLHRSKR